MPQLYSSWYRQEGSAEDYPISKYTPAELYTSMVGLNIGLDQLLNGGSLKQFAARPTSCPDDACCVPVNCDIIGFISMENSRYVSTHWST